MANAEPSTGYSRLTIAIFNKLRIPIVIISPILIITVVTSTISILENDKKKLFNDEWLSSKGLSTAVCVSGQLRSLTMLPTNKYHPKSWDPMSASIPFPNQSVAQSIQNNLYPKLNNPDVFMSISTQQTKREPNKGDLKACEPLRPRGGYLGCEVPMEKEVETVGNESFWKDFSNPSRKSIKGFLQQLKGMYDCYKMIERHSILRGKTYDWIVRLRPDMYIHDFPSIEKLVKEKNIYNTILYSDKGSCCCGNEDTFAFGRYQIMVPLLERIAHIQFVDVFSEGQQFSSETHLVKYLLVKGIQLKEHPTIKACLVKPTYRSLSDISVP